MDLNQVTCASAPCLLPPAEVYRRTTLSRTTIWRRVREGSFPAPARLGAQRVAWPETAVSAWIEKQAALAGSATQ